MLSSFLRPVSPRLNTPMIRGLVLAVGITLLSFAAAQQCTYEIEPNDTPAEATLVTGVGPDGVGNAPNARSAPSAWPEISPAVIRTRSGGKSTS